MAFGISPTPCSGTTSAGLAVLIFRAIARIHAHHSAEINSRLGGELRRPTAAFSSLEVQRERRESELSANARATGEVLTVEQSSNNDKGDVENTIQVLAELKKQQREAPFKAPQMDAPVQYTVLAEIRPDD